MIIRRVFRFENAHVVRNCTTERCRESIHGHGYRVEVLFKASGIDLTNPSSDVAALVPSLRDLIGSFDDAMTFWDRDDSEYVSLCKTVSARWVSLPVSPSAEQFSRVIFLLVDKLLAEYQGDMKARLSLDSIIVHETETGYAQAYRGDVENVRMGKIDFDNIRFSDDVEAGWSSPGLDNFRRTEVGMSV